MPSTFPAPSAASAKVSVPCSPQHDPAALVSATAGYNDADTSNRVLPVNLSEAAAVGLLNAAAVPMFTTGDQPTASALLLAGAISGSTALTAESGIPARSTSSCASDVLVSHACCDSGDTNNDGSCINGSKSDGSPDGRAESGIKVPRPASAGGGGAVAVAPTAACSDSYGPPAQPSMHAPLIPEESTARHTMLGGGSAVLAAPEHVPVSNIDRTYKALLGRSSPIFFGAPPSPTWNSVAKKISVPGAAAVPLPCDVRLLLNTELYADSVDTLLAGLVLPAVAGEHARLLRASQAAFLQERVRLILRAPVFETSMHAVLGPGMSMAQPSGPGQDMLCFTTLVQQQQLDTWTADLLVGGLAPPQQQSQLQATGAAGAAAVMPDFHRIASTKADLSAVTAGGGTSSKHQAFGADSYSGKASTSIRQQSTTASSLGLNGSRQDPGSAHLISDVRVVTIPAGIPPGVSGGLPVPVPVRAVGTAVPADGPSTASLTVLPSPLPSASVETVSITAASASAAVNSIGQVAPDSGTPFPSEGSHLQGSPQQEPMQQKQEILLKIDSTCQARITANDHTQLCFLAFLEEFSLLVGCNGLFKRSLVLIRAWWRNETISYVGESIYQSLNDEAIAVMVCAIFNKYHLINVTADVSGSSTATPPKERPQPQSQQQQQQYTSPLISSPLQALALFVIEYASYDGATQVITLQGIQRFEDISPASELCIENDDCYGSITGQPASAASLRHCGVVDVPVSIATPRRYSQMLIPGEMLVKYWLLTHPSPSSSAEPSSISASATQQGFSTTFAASAVAPAVELTAVKELMSAVVKAEAEAEVATKIAADAMAASAVVLDAEVSAPAACSPNTGLDTPCNTEAVPLAAAVQSQASVPDTSALTWTVSAATLVAAPTIATTTATAAALIASFSAAFSSRFSRGRFNVMHPFSCENMVKEQLSFNRALRLSKALQGGRDKLKG